MMDYRCLSAGADWADLPETYVIFITAKDVLGHNKPLYHINRIIEEAESVFDDGAHIIYVNGECIDESTELGKMLSDFKCRKAADMKSSILAARMRMLKETDEGVAAVCEIMEKYGDKREAKGKLESVVSLFKKGKITEEDAADEIGMTVADFKKAVESVSLQ